MEMFQRTQRDLGAARIEQMERERETSPETAWENLTTVNDDVENGAKNKSRSGKEEVPLWSNNL